MHNFADNYIEGVSAILRRMPMLTECTIRKALSDGQLYAPQFTFPAPVIAHKLIKLSLELFDDSVFAGLTLPCLESLKLRGTRYWPLLVSNMETIFRAAQSVGAGSRIHQIRF